MKNKVNDTIGFKTYQGVWKREVKKHLEQKDLSEFFGMHVTSEILTISWFCPLAFSLLPPPASTQTLCTMFI